MAKIIKIEQAVPVIQTKKKVAAYARVSMESERMNHSLSAQISYYSSLIQKNPGWQYAGVYADYGITGTLTAKREQFQKMLSDCEEGKIDKLKQHIQSASAAQQEDSRQEISRLRRRLEELEQITAKLYEDKVRGAISGDSFSVLIQKNEQERIQKSEHLDSLLAGERKAQQDIANIHQWAGTIRQYLDLQELNREIIEELIDRIEVGERTVIDGQRHQDIKIYYRFVGLV